MSRPYASRSVFCLLAAACLAVALPITAAPVSATPAQVSHLDDEVTRRLQTSDDTTVIPVIVEAPESRVRSSGGQVSGSSALLGASAAELTPAQIRSLSNDPSVGRIHFDAPVRASATVDSASAGATPITFDQTIGAPQVWQTGDTGRGVTVAVLDTGIDNNPAAFGSRVTARVDLVNRAKPEPGDPAGHGTHVAGIVGARGFASPGVAPDVSLVSVRVLDEQGQSRMSTVIAGLEWTIQHKAELGIRVVVMALGAPIVGSYRDDPLAAAVEMAWHSGLVVVAAAGNAGPDPGSISSPGYDPLVLTVGAADENGTPTSRDDVVPAWSSQGPTADGVAKPDLVAPGRKIVSVRVPGSTLDRLLPTHIEGPQTFRLSGTSEATAVTAGSVALLLQRRGELRPDEAKSVLTHSTDHLAGATPGAAGSGEINVARALHTPAPAHSRQSARPSTALILLLETLGPSVWGDALDEATNDEHDGKNLVGADHVKWDDVNWDHVMWDHVMWDHVMWDHVMWDHVMWDHVTWDHVMWDHVMWDHVMWDRANLD